MQILSNLLSFSDVLKSIGGIVLAVVILLAMVTVHEFGHYVAGKILGFKINEFAVGFGPALLKKRSKKTGELFALRIVPLGGYCAFDGEDEYDEEKEKDQDPPFAEMQNEGGMVETNEQPQAKRAKDEYPEPQGERFNDQPPWKRIIVLVAGATMNYLLALLLIVCMFAFIGRPVYSVYKEAPGEIASQGAIETYETGLRTGDVILELNGKTVYLFTDLLDELKGKKKGETVELLVIRDGKEQTVSFALFEDAVVDNMSDNRAVFFSLGLAYREEVTNAVGETSVKVTRSASLTTVSTQEGFFQTIGHSFVYSFKIGGTVLRSLGELLTGKLGLETMGGPITTIKITSEAASSGVMSFLNIAAFIGVNLAVFNLLPVPALDGCKVIFCIIEWIRKKPVNRKVETIINLVGIVFLFGFAILVDILQFF